MKQELNPNAAELNRATQALWEQKAEFWDSLMGESGNIFHQTLVAPTAEKLLEVQPGQLIGDIACGNGTFARRLAELGAQVIAGDFSPRFIELAEKRSAGTELAAKISYRLLDATDEAQLLALGAGTFDSLVCNMALMDIADIAPLARSIPRLLKPGGKFVVSLPHPAFNSNATVLMAEEEDRGGSLSEIYAIKMKDYLNIPPGKGMGSPGEPAPHYYFHRPLHVLLNEFFRHGLLLDRLEEPAFITIAKPQRALAWGNFTNFPPVLVFRLRLL